MSIYEQLFSGKLKKGMGISNVTDEFFALAVNNLFNQNRTGILIVTPTLFEANKIYEMIRNYQKEVYLFPMDDFLTSQAIAVSSEYLLKRLELMRDLISNDKKIVVTHLEGYLHYLPGVDEFKQNIIQLKVGDNINISDLTSRLIDNGYVRQTIVTQTGEIGIRGFVVDIFCALDDEPIRIEFFDNEIESIRTFDIDTQRMKINLNSVKIMPFIESKTSNIASISDYFNDKIVIYKDYNQLLSSYERLVTDALELDNKKNCNDYFNDLTKITDKEAIQYLDFDSDLVNKKLKIDHYDVKNIDSFNENFDKLSEYLNTLVNKKTVVLALNKKLINRLLKFLDVEYVLTDENNIFKNKVNIISTQMNKGLIYDDYVFITEKEIYNTKTEHVKMTTSFKQSSKLSDITKLVIGDYVVHNLYGIGVYNGIKMITKNGLKKDYLEVLYAKGDKLYIPVEKISLIGKYAGSDGAVPKISTLGGTEWTKTKNRIRENLEMISQEIILVQAKRKMQKGFKFSPDTSMQTLFENEFMYELTKDQESVTDEVKHDMESIIPMDRMVCGDVGYGKTEVAFRAIFKAICDSKQVLYLCPTTLLSKQIFDNAIERFKNYPVKIGLLNRFTTQKETKRILKGLESGTYDFVIGTHRLLSDDIKPKDLGLLVVDEEQRFGVSHKEKIKKYKANIDILTLTATPIPRTLKLSLLGLKDLSVINTPPKNRLPVQTYVIEENDYLIKNIIYKELSRNGQVFVLDNRITNFDERYRQLQKLAPDANIVCAHGQMDSYQLEDAMFKFVNGEYDVLLCTTIIENGIDIPNVNSLIVLDSDRLGLSQLYQIRGRVGRSDRLAFAYLMYNKNKVLTDSAMKRLRAIKDYTDLGSGLRIANKDLAIRGAGDILGNEQTGFVDAIGMELYFKMLNQEIAKLKGELLPDDKDDDLKPLINVETHIDDEYVSDMDLKIEIHKKINEIDSYSKLTIIKSEIEDRFGKIDETILNYMYEEWFEKMAHKLEIINVEEKQDYIEVAFSKEKSETIDYQDLFVRSLKITNQFQFKYKNKLFYIKLFLKDLDKHPIYYLNELLKEM